MKRISRRIGSLPKLVLLAAGAASLGLSALYFSRTPHEQAPQEQRRYQARINREETIQAGVDLEVISAGPDAFSGTKLALERRVQSQWAEYAPVRIMIPELGYSAPFPVENGAMSAETSFPQPVPRNGNGYTYLVIGRDPATGADKELFKHIVQAQHK